MRRTYCDRCGVEDEGGRKGGRVVRVTMEPMSRTMDLCGDCRSSLQPLLDGFLEGQASLGVRRQARDDVAEAIECLRESLPIKKCRPDTATWFLRRALKNWTAA